MESCVCHKLSLSTGSFGHRCEKLFRIKLFLEIIAFSWITVVSVSANQSFEYEKLHNFGMGRRIIPSLRRMAYEFPEPLPSPKPVILLERSPFRKIYQGIRRKSLDRRVFKRDFDYPASEEGHKLVCESMLNCFITHVAVETKDGIPIILRGGVGYRHFTIVVRAKPGDRLKGTIRIYCNQDSGNGNT